MDVVNDAGDTALCLALLHADPKIAKALLDAGASPWPVARRPPAAPPAAPPAKAPEEAAPSGGGAAPEAAAVASGTTSGGPAPGGGGGHGGGSGGACAGGAPAALTTEEAEALASGAPLFPDEASEKFGGLVAEMLEDLAVRAGACFNAARSWPSKFFPARNNTLGENTCSNVAI